MRQSRAKDSPSRRWVELSVELQEQCLKITPARSNSLSFCRIGETAMWPLASGVTEMAIVCQNMYTLYVELKSREESLQDFGECVPGPLRRSRRESTS